MPPHLGASGLSFKGGGLHYNLPQPGKSLGETFVGSKPWQSRSWHIFSKLKAFEIRSSSFIQTTKALSVPWTKGEAPIAISISQFIVHTLSSAQTSSHHISSTFLPNLILLTPSRAESGVLKPTD